MKPSSKILLPNNVSARLLSEDADSPRFLVKLRNLPSWTSGSKSSLRWHHPCQETSLGRLIMAQSSTYNSSYFRVLGSADLAWGMFPWRQTLLLLNASVYSLKKMETIMPSNVLMHKSAGKLLWQETEGTHGAESSRMSLLSLLGIFRDPLSSASHSLQMILSGVSSFSSRIDLLNILWSSVSEHRPKQYKCKILV